MPLAKPEKIEVRAPGPPKPPARAPLILAAGFLITIFVGSLLLALPIANRQGEITPYITALFTATSAVCVTGLVVVDTLTFWSPFGQAVILGLIQVGGLGFMTSSTILFLLIGHRASLRNRILLKESHGVSPIGGVLRLTRRVILVTVLIEGVGAALLFLRFSLEFPVDWALWMGVFHSISAFNNAGFDIIGGFRSLTVFNGDHLVLLTFGLLLVLGGISFTVIVDLWDTRNWRSLVLDTKLVLFATAALLVVGAIGILIVENANGATLGPMEVPGKLANALFTAATPRTAGFNSIDTGQMTQAGLFLTIALMYIGAASGSTGGGIKVNTFAVLTSAVISSIRGKDRTAAFGRELPQDQINRALTVTLLALGLVFGVTLVLSSTEPFTFLQLLFEATSAFGTVGLSTGITPNLSLIGKLVIILTMYVGRVGPLTVALALAQRQKPETYRYPEGRVKIG
ncbi:MAG TPA: TrkH family potassium uptake protein [Chloroflexota bacterium]|nr:TrkH family potassium uptake protein [Chloroflexota bacterium]